MQIPLVSVITAVYNRRSTLPRAIESLLRQQFQDFEWIAVDDGSTDGSFEIVKKYASLLHHVQLIQKSHTGIADTWNTGIRAAQGTWITFLDSDDAYQPDHLQIRVDYILAHPETDLLHSTATLIGREEDFWVPDRHNPSRNIHLKDCAIGATFFMKRKVWEILGGYRPVLFPDADFLERASARFTVVKIDAPTYVYYRNSSDSFLTRVKSKDQNDKQ
ncbi:MAG: glycosyltransferase [Thermoflavifilum aggregans]|nr:glycosyltransferase [Thermoflavifilum aggregans]